MRIFYKISALLTLFLISISSSVASSRVAIVVNSHLLPKINENINIFLKDLRNEGYTPILKSWSLESQRTPQELKDYLISLYNESNSLQGAIFIGDLPVAWFEVNSKNQLPMLSDEKEFEQRYPTDKFFADLDGNQWYDSDGNGYFDFPVVNYNPSEKNEIWVSRIKASNLSYLGKSEPDIVNAYLEKNHKYRTGQWVFPKMNFAYMMDDILVYSKDFNYWTTPSVDRVLGKTNKQGFLQIMQQGYEFGVFGLHGNPLLVQPDNLDNLKSSEMATTSYQVNVPLINAYSCSIGRYTHANYFAGQLLFNNNSKALALISHTTPQTSWRTKTLMDGLNLGKNFGTALKDTTNFFLEKLMEGNITAFTYSLEFAIYVMLDVRKKVILGDGTLKLQKFMQRPASSSQLISSRNYDSPDVRWPTYLSAETPTSFGAPSFSLASGSTIPEKPILRDNLIYFPTVQSSPNEKVSLSIFKYKLSDSGLFILVDKQKFPANTTLTDIDDDSYFKYQVKRKLATGEVITSNLSLPSERISNGDLFIPQISNFTNNKFILSEDDQFLVAENTYARVFKSYSKNIDDAELVFDGKVDADGIDINPIHATEGNYWIQYYWKDSGDIVLESTFSKRISR